MRNLELEETDRRLLKRLVKEEGDRLRKLLDEQWILGHPAEGQLEQVKKLGEKLQ